MSALKSRSPALVLLLVAGLLATACSTDTTGPSDRHPSLEGSPAPSDSLRPAFGTRHG